MGYVRPLAGLWRGQLSPKRCALSKRGHRESKLGVNLQHRRSSRRVTSTHPQAAPLNSTNSKELFEKITGWKFNSGLLSIFSPPLPQPLISWAKFWEISSDVGQDIFGCEGLLSHRAFTYYVTSFPHMFYLSRLLKCIYYRLWACGVQRLEGTMARII